MKESEINELAAKGIFCKKRINGKVEETHISWVILTKKRAFKIKKPLKLSFLDFSTIQLRKEFCKKEIELNSRFTNIYEDVVPIHTKNGRWYIGNGKGKAIDYAVQMKRMMTGKRMDNLLQRRKVHDENIRSLARVTAVFHKNAKEVDLPFNLAHARNTFNDINQIRNFVLDQLGLSAAQIIDQSIQWSNDFLMLHAKRIQQRIEHGFKRDVHGDLHSGNIFLYKSPVLFDCIEFNDQYRQIDVLYEVAFLCMDLEAVHQKHLAKIFLAEYNRNIRCFEVPEDERIFTYFKCLRANVRAKVHALSTNQMKDVLGMKSHIDETKKYLSLMKKYVAQFAVTDKI